MSTAPQRPTVRLFAVCEDAVLALPRASDPPESWWELHNCLHTVWMPPGVNRKFQAKELTVFAQITDGLGTFSFGVVVEEVDLANPKRDRVMGRSDPLEMVFDSPWDVLEDAVTLKDIPFPRPGLYRFRLMEGGKEVEGGVAYIRVKGGDDQ